MIASLTNRETNNLLEAYNNVAASTSVQVLNEREDDDIEAISKYENVKSINLYVKPADGAIEQLYSANVEPVNINVTNSVVTLIGTDSEQSVEIQVVIQKDGSTSIVPISDDGKQVDGPWFEKDPMFWDTGNSSELNLMIIQEV